MYPSNGSSNMTISDPISTLELGMDCPSCTVNFIAQRRMDLE